ncbi:hypothetical protein [uncultured Clostridium sp.]|uniref:hypothetical protein n=1 Tax=uncultured Clostridium sp. TaxID=59620 RepID=UPI0026002560|nr:hypothetical protein [uncultured Clostridium sp.]
MNYTEGIKFMKQFIGKEGVINPYEDIILHYPGRKRKGDYQLSLKNGQVPTHGLICSVLYNLIINKIYTYDNLLIFLEDVYLNGTNTAYPDPNLEYYKHLIYWITLQEEINYPRNKGFAGIKLAFCRFFEAIYCTKPEATFNLDQVLIRCNNHGTIKPTLFEEIEDKPNFYNY